MAHPHAKIQAVHPTPLTPPPPQPGGYSLSVSVPKIIFFLLSILKTSSNFTQIQVEPHLNRNKTFKYERKFHCHIGIVHCALFFSPILKPDHVSTGRLSQGKLSNYQPPKSSRPVCDVPTVRGAGFTKVVKVAAYTK